MDPSIVSSLIPIFSAALVVPVEYPIERIISIRQAQGALKGFEYSNVISCLRKMPNEQGGIRNLWRGLGPFMFAKIGASPLNIFLQGVIRNTITTFNPNPSGMEIFYANYTTLTLSGGLTTVLIHPFKMASLKLQLDLGGGTLGSRAPYQNTFQVFKQISEKAGIFSLPFNLKGGLFRGLLASFCYGALHNSIYVGFYDTMKPLLLTNQQGAASLMLMKFSLGIFTTNLAQFVVYPISTAITRAQAAVAPAVSLKGVSSPVEYRGALDAIIKVTRNEGVSALWRGFGLNLARSLSGALLLIVYDMFRH